MTTEIVSGSFSGGFCCTTVQSNFRSIEFRELVIDFAEELGFDDRRIAQELRFLLDLLHRRQEENAEHIAELEKRRNTANRQPR